MRYLLLHGFTGAPASTASLAAPPGSVAPTLGGHLSTEVTGGYWHEVERLAELGRDCDALFGYSLGGRLALGILARHPQRFRRAVIVSAHPGLTTDDERRARRAADARFVELLRARGLEAFVDEWEALPLWASQARLSAELLRQQREQRLAHSAEGLAQSLLRHGLGEMPDLRPLLARVTTPVQVLAGEQDPKFCKLARELAALLPHAGLHLVPGAGHNLLLEEPRRCREALLEGASS